MKALIRIGVAVALIALAVGALAATGIAGAKSTKPEKVKVLDNFFKPDSVKIKKGKKVRWKWSDKNFNSHNVTLKKGPSGVKKSKFTSQTALHDYTFTKRFKKPGKYNFYCTIHPDIMRMKVTVKR